MPFHSLLPNAQRKCSPAVPQEWKHHRTLSPAAKNGAKYLPAHVGSSEGIIGEGTSIQTWFFSLIVPNKNRLIQGPNHSCWPCSEKPTGQRFVLLIWQHFTFTHITQLISMGKSLQQNWAEKSIYCPKLKCHSGNIFTQIPRIWGLAEMARQWTGVQKNFTQLK